MNEELTDVPNINLPGLSNEEYGNSSQLTASDGPNIFKAQGHNPPVQ